MFAAMVVFLCGFVSDALAREPAKPQLTVQQVIDMALKNSKSLRSIEYNKEKSWEIREDAAEDVHFKPDRGGGTPNSFMESTFTNLMQASLNYRIQGKKLEQEKKKVSLDAYTKYVNVLIAHERLESAEVTKGKAILAERLARAGYNVGTVDQPGLIAAESAADAAMAAWQEANEQLDKAYYELNSLIGLWPEDRPELVDDVVLDPFVIDNIQAEINRAENSNEDLWNLQQLIDLQKMDLKYFNYGPGSGMLYEYDVEKYDVDIAKMNEADARQQIAEGVTTLYKNIKALEEQCNQLASTVNSLEESLRVARVKYEVGMATQMDVKKAESDLAETKSNLAEMKYNHAILVATFKNMTGKNIV
jgi:outer membrane protein TolC